MGGRTKPLSSAIHPCHPRLAIPSVPPWNRDKTTPLSLCTTSLGLWALLVVYLRSTRLQQLRPGWWRCFDWLLPRPAKLHYYPSVLLLAPVRSICQHAITVRVCPLLTRNAIPNTAITLENSSRRVKTPSSMQNLVSAIGWHITACSFGHPKVEATTCAPNCASLCKLLSNPRFCLQRFRTCWHFSHGNP
ncbi:uncharacterized protein BCR38DRAFT_160616 [Pseudomassariella vexata]|uniref:Uncharacterized protein n=1 Tax=Pseudomassariella vexata TaxID=1141098 RepID=A0A1Y2E7Q7_9PEZI|nr:uncharacterized protein BCR38DRAFT_160616 [Pseudomassariella vexata]ORY67598.1 hypothetical protein BCR38DRAFT_160616 [Pseudomassariella vexata]